MAEEEKYKVVEGDRISSIAARRCTTVDKILAKNPQLADRTKRNPEMLMPGEELVMPPKEVKNFHADERTCSTTVIEPIPSRLQLKLQVAGMPLKPQAFKWKLGRDPYPGEGKDAQWKGGQVTAEGVVSFDVPPTATEAVVYLPSLGFEFLARIGYLHPPSALSGVQQRLNNLGYACALSPPGEDPSLRKASAARTAHAIKRFEEHHGMTLSGAATWALQEAIRKVHEPQSAPVSKVAPIPPLRGA